MVGVGVVCMRVCVCVFVHVLCAVPLMSPVRQHRTPIGRTQYLYTARLNLSKLERPAVQQLEDVAVRYNVTHLAEYLEALRLMGSGGGSPTKGKSAIRTQFKNAAGDPEAMRHTAAKRGEERLAADLRTLLLRPQSAAPPKPPPGNGADVRFSIDGKHIWAHRALLVATSRCAQANRGMLEVF